MMEIPIIPKFPLVGYEPTLNQLVKFIQDYQIDDEKLTMGVDSYQSFINKYNGTYYLCGKLQMKPYELITTKKMEKALAKLKNEWGRGHYRDIIGQEHVLDKFKSFLKLLTVYYDTIARHKLNDNAFYLYKLSNQCEL